MDFIKLGKSPIVLLSPQFPYRSVLHQLILLLKTEAESSLFPTFLSPTPFLRRPVRLSDSGIHSATACSITRSHSLSNHRYISRKKKIIDMEVMIHSSSFLLPTIPASDGAALTYALVLLNQPLPRFTPLLWRHATLRLCADGGANRVYDEFPQLFPHEDAFSVRNRYKPDVIKGDMDSIRTEVLEFYRNLGTEIIDESHDQETTDLHKCVNFIRDFYPNIEESKLCILVAGALGGRFDHEMGNINVICHFSSIRIILLSEDCLIQLLPSACRHEIHIQSSIEGPHCGLIPIGTPSANTTTTGLQWNLSNTEMRFGGLISTSNIVEEEIVTVRSDSDLLWTITILFPSDMEIR